MENKTLYQLMTDPAFIKFNDWLTDHELDFQQLTDIQLRMNIAIYCNDIQRELIDWLEAYQNAD